MDISMVLLKIGLCGFLAFVREIVKVGGKGSQWQSCFLHR